MTHLPEGALFDTIALNMRKRKKHGLYNMEVMRTLLDSYNQELLENVIDNLVSARYSCSCDQLQTKKWNSSIPFSKNRSQSVDACCGLEDFQSKPLEKSEAGKIENNQKIFTYSEVIKLFDLYLRLGGPNRWIIVKKKWSENTRTRAIEDGICIRCRGNFLSTLLNIPLVVVHRLHSILRVAASENKEIKIDAHLVGKVVRVSLKDILRDRCPGEQLNHLPLHGPLKRLKYSMYSIMDYGIFIKQLRAEGTKKVLTLPYSCKRLPDSHICHPTPSLSQFTECVLVDRYSAQQNGKINLDKTVSEGDSTDVNRHEDEYTSHPKPSFENPEPYTSFVLSGLPSDEASKFLTFCKSRRERRVTESHGTHLASDVITNSLLGFPYSRSSREGKNGFSEKEIADLPLNRPKCITPRVSEECVFRAACITDGRVRDISLTLTCF